jgi:two-component system, OmpR family, phosphate regulon sensor histidine kinase PhoR
MEPEHLGGVFKRFFRAHADRDEELGTEGMGLGLSIVADCVDNMRGTVGVESEAGVGTTFSVVLPIGDSEPVLAGPGD